MVVVNGLGTTFIPQMAIDHGLLENQESRCDRSSSQSLPRHRPCVATKPSSRRNLPSISRCGIWRYCKRYHWSAYLIYIFERPVKARCSCFAYSTVNYQLLLALTLRSSSKLIAMVTKSSRSVMMPTTRHGWPLVSSPLVFLHVNSRLLNPARGSTDITLCA